MTEAQIHKAVIATVNLPYPPSINALYRSVAGRSIMSKAYRDWRDTAGILLRNQKPEKVKGPVSISVALTAPDKRRRDLDNVGFKAIVDLLVLHKVIEADDGRIVRKIAAEWVESDHPCVVEVRAA